jgi:putative transposase
LVTGANRPDMKKLAELVDAILVPLPSPLESHLTLDRGSDYDACRAAAVARGFIAHIPPKASAEQPLPPPGDPARHPPRRWVVEVGHGWFTRVRRRLTRWDHQGNHDLGFVQLAAVLIIYRTIRHVRSLSG